MEYQKCSFRGVTEVIPVNRRTSFVGIAGAFTCSALLLVIGACSPTAPAVGEGAVVVQTRSAEYAAGDSVHLRIHNIYDRTVDGVLVGSGPENYYIDGSSNFEIANGDRW
jgi:hypothetical protein